MKTNERYQGKPLLRLLECYVLDAIGELSPEDGARLTAMQPKLSEVYKRSGTWQHILEAEMDFPSQLSEEIVQLWLAKNGCVIEQVKESDGSPDLRINDSQDKCDVFSPSATKGMKGIWDVAMRKVYKQKAPYVIIKVKPNGQDINEIKKYFNDENNKIEGIKQVFVIKDEKLYIIY